MAVDTKTKYGKKVAEAFNVGTKSTDDEQSEEYAYTTTGEESFDELCEKTSEALGDLKEKGVALAVEKKTEKEQIKENGDDVSSIHDDVKEMCDDDGSKQDEINFDELTEDAPDVEEGPPADEEPVEEPTEEPEEASEEEEETEKVFLPGFVGKHDEKIEWKVESPANLWDSFYKKKLDYLFKMLPGGVLDFPAIEQELEELVVNDLGSEMRGEVFDAGLMQDKMDILLGYRERVRHLSMKVNNQYFLFKGLIGKLEGFLARTQYIKPQIKQEGLVLEHLGDMFQYLHKLEAAYHNIKNTEDVLKMANDMLSRKITLCMPYKAREVYESQVDHSSSPSQQQRRTSSQRRDDEIEGSGIDIKGDELPTDPIAKPAEEKVGEVGWDEL